MISEKQLAANRANALKSTGPRTEAGRERSKLNACRHHLTGQVTTMTDPDRAAYSKFLKEMVADFAPVGAVETQLAQRIATDHWRLNRAAAIEENLFSIGVGSMGDDICDNHPEIEDSMNQARVYVIRSKQLNLLSLYEQRLNRSIQKNMDALQKLQSERGAARQARRQADAFNAHLELLRSERGATETPSHTVPSIVQSLVPQQLARSNGFVFSNASVSPSEPARDVPAPSEPGFWPPRTAAA